MRLSHLSTLSLLTAAIGFSFASTAQAAQSDAPDLSNAQFQQCLDGLKNSSKFRGVDSYTFNNYRPSQPAPSVIASLIYKKKKKKDVPVFPGDDPREFWVRAEDRTSETAGLYNKLGLADYEAIEAFVKWKFD